MTRLQRFIKNRRKTSEKSARVKRLIRKYKGNKKDIANARAYVRRVKLSSRCVECGESRPWCLHYHHRKKSTKIMGVHEMASYGFPIKMIKEEINKCDCLCANDHAQKHYRRFFLKEQRFTK